jgi:hypothetical protein
MEVKSRLRSLPAVNSASTSIKAVKAASAASRGGAHAAIASNVRRMGIEALA